MSTILKKNTPKLWEKTGKREAVKKNDEISVKRQCELLGVNRSGIYYKPVLPSLEKIEREEMLKGYIDLWCTRNPALGTRGLQDKFRLDRGIEIGRALLKRLMLQMGLRAVYPHKNTSISNKLHPKFPYLLRDMEIFLPNQVWAVDITYIKIGRTHMYLTAIIDWYSRSIVGWELSDTLETAPVLEAVKAAIAKYGIPAIINSDQGSQFTSEGYISFLAQNGIRQSMDGRARWVDNVIIERWFRTLKCDYIYINEFNSPRELRQGIADYIQLYNNERPHSSINNYPMVVYGNSFNNTAA